jgi:DNA-directed RNA polymerase specialized sigma24 family protein
MGSEAGEQPVDPACPGLAVQPHDRPVPKAWLDELETTEAARSLEERLTGDVDLLTVLALQNYEGADYDVFAGELAKYGMAVISSWMRRGTVFARCRERGFGGLPPAPYGAFRDPDTVDGIAGETVAKALKHFREDVLLKHKWTSAGGATVKTYFIGQCLIRFANVYRAWWRQETSAPLPAGMEVVATLADRGVPGPEEAAVDWQMSMQGLRHATTDRVRRLLVLVAADLPRPEIAERLGMTEKAVERALAYHQGRMRRLSA